MNTTTQTDANLLGLRAFRATAETEPIRLQIDGEGTALEAPYVAADDHGYGYAWISPEQIPAALEAVNGPGGDTYGLNLDFQGRLWLLDPNDDPRECVHAAGRYAVGPWRWTEVEEDVDRIIAEGERATDEILDAREREGSW